MCVNLEFFPTFHIGKGNGKVYSKGCYQRKYVSKKFTPKRKMTIADVKKVQDDALPDLKASDWNFFKYNCKAFSKDVYEHITARFSSEISSQDAVQAADQSRYQS